MPVDVREALSSWIPAGRDVAIMDVPVHRNVGDLFILTSTLNLLAALRCRVVYSAGLRDFRLRTALRHIGAETILVGLGGGNLGDLYPPYQRLRETVLRSFPRHRIVILPQTVHFSSAGAHGEAIRRFRDHGDLRIAVRDRASLDMLADATPHLALMPDVVHALTAPRPASATSTASRGTVTLLRRDTEGRTRPLAAGSIDWAAVYPEFNRRMALMAAAMSLAPAPAGQRLHRWWAGYAADLLSRGTEWMAGAEHVVTDRLHAAIVARRAGRPVTLVETGYGKLSAYYGEWWRDDPNVTLATDVRSPQRPNRGRRS